MPITTNRALTPLPPEDEDVRELLEEAQRAGAKLFVEEYEVCKGWFRVRNRFTVLNYMGRDQYQVINIDNSKESTIAYLCGVMYSIGSKGK